MLVIHPHLSMGWRLIHDQVTVMEVCWPQLWLVMNPSYCIRVSHLYMYSTVLEGVSHSSNNKVLVWCKLSSYFGGWWHIQHCYMLECITNLTVFNTGFQQVHISKGHMIHKYYPSILYGFDAHTLSLFVLWVQAIRCKCWWHCIVINPSLHQQGFGVTFPWHLFYLWKLAKVRQSSMTKPFWNLVSGEADPSDLKSISDSQLCCCCTPSTPVRQAVYGREPADRDTWPHRDPTPLISL